MGSMFDDSMRSSRRRQWTLFRGGATAHLQRVGTHLAEDGCPDSQVLLAKQLLLEESDPDIDEEENARQGVYWLIRASEQGHKEATKLLRQCLNSGRGINEHNFLDVKACLDVSEDEKQAVKVAKDIFTTMSEGEDFITSEQLYNALKLAKRVSDGMSDETRKKLIRDLLDGNFKNNAEAQNWRSRLDEDVDKITEDMLVTAAHTYSHGELPKVGKSLILHEYNAYSKSYLNFLLYTLAHPLIAAYWIYGVVINILSLRTILSFLVALSPFVKTLLSLFLYMTLKFDNFTFIPLLVYYSSLAIMIGATCQILCHKREFCQFRSWSNLFLLYSEGNFVPDRAEVQHCRKALSTYAWFFVSLLIHLATQSYDNLKVPYHSELTAVAFLFAFLTLYSFTITGPRYCTWSSWSLDSLGVLSIICHMIARYPHEINTIIGFDWRFLDFNFPAFSSHLIGQGIEFCLNFRALFYLFIPAILLKMAARANWAGIYTDLVPHCITLSWWQLSLLLSQDAIWNRVAQTVLAFGGLALFLPITCLVTIILPIYAVSVYYQTHGYHIATGITTFLALLLPILTLYCNRSRATTAKFFTILQVSLSLIAAGVLLSQNSPELMIQSDVSSTGLDLEWPDFITYCNFGKSESEIENIETQISCSQLIGTTVYWKGYVKSSRVSKIFNSVTKVTDMLPSVLSRFIICLLGDRYQSCNEDDEICNKLINKCHATRWNIYEINIDVQMNQNNGLWSPSSEELVLIADNSFYNFTKSLAKNDHIWFSGQLVGDENNILSPMKTKVKLSAIGCLLCNSAISSYTTDNLKISFSDLKNYGKFVLNFLLNPLIIFR